MSKLLMSNRVLSRIWAKMGGINLDGEHEDKTDQDVKLFIDGELKRLAETFLVDAASTEQIRTNLIGRSEKTFLWVNHAIKKLFKIHTPKTRETLEKPIESLLSAFRSLLGQIESTNKGDCLLVIGLMTVTRGKFTLREMTMFFNSGASSWKLQEAGMREVVIQCRPILRLRGDGISFVHPALRDFMVSHEASGELRLRSSDHSIYNLHQFMACACIKYIMRDGSIETLRAVAVRNVENRFALNARGSFRGVSNDTVLEYAMFNWPYHVRNCRELSFQLLGFWRERWRDRPGLKDIWSLVNGYNNKFPELYNYKPVVPYPCDASKTSEFSFACILNIVPWVQSLLKLRDSSYYESIDIFGQTPLCCAVYHANEEIAKLLLEHGCRVDQKNPQGAAPIHIAAVTDNCILIALLVEYGSNVNLERERDGDTPLQIACGDFHSSDVAVNVATLLIDLGAYVDARDMRGFTALHKAASSSDNEPLVKFLLARGANSNAQASSGQTALHCAAMHGKAKTTRVLLENGADPLVEDFNGRTALHSIENGSKDEKDEMVEILRQHISVDIRDGHGLTPLNLAARHGDLDLASTLLRKGANLLLTYGTHSPT